METTLCIIKPDGVERKQVGRIIDILERKFTFESMEMKKLSPDEVQGFYAEHRGKAFFDDLVRYMSSGKVVLMTLGGENAVARLRELLGTTDPQSAAPGTLRREFGVNLQQNTIHGSDSLTSAEREIAYFFG